jgi:hypothetical protein
MRPRRASRSGLFLVVAACVAAPARGADTPTPLAPGVRGLVTRAPAGIKVDGKLAEWADAFCTPVHYNHGNLAERAAQFFYLWDDQALYIGLRALDQHRANVSRLEVISDGDAVELYLDTRQGPALRGKDWSKGAIHLFFTPFEGTNLTPRWVVRQGIATSDVKLQGVEIAATVLPGGVGYEVEFKVPWANFPEFTPKLGALMAIDAELCSSDGARRTDRTFAYGSPLSVQQPASQGTVELVKALEPEYLPQVGPAAFPFWVETPWVQLERANVRATVGIPPAFAEVVGDVEIRLHNTDGAIVKTVKAKLEPFGPPGLGFVRALAYWSIDEFAPNTYFATARVVSKTGKTIATVAPRMIEEAQVSGR